MFAVALAAVAWAVLAPCQISGSGDPSPTVSTKHPSAAPAAPVKELSAEKRQALVQRRFQRPLFDPPPPPPPVVEKKPPPTVTLKLLATMPEPGGGQAMFLDAQGSMILKSVGDDVPASSGRATLTEIANDHVLLRCQDTVITLKLGKE